MPEALKRQIGPFPLGVWLIIIIVGGGLGVVMNRRIGATDEEPIVLEPDTGRDDYSAGTGGVFPRVTGATLLSPAPTAATDPTSYAPTTNDEWVAQAVKRVTTGDGAPLPLAALEALQKFVDGQSLTATERGIVNRAVGLLGPPPYGATIVPASSPQAKPITPTVPTQPKYRTRSEAIVAEAYRDILGRAPDAGGLSYWSGLLSSGRITQDELRRELAASAESKRILAGK